MPHSNLEPSLERREKLAESSRWKSGPGKGFSGPPGSMCCMSRQRRRRPTGVGRQLAQKSKSLGQFRGLLTHCPGFIRQNVAWGHQEGYQAGPPIFDLACWVQRREGPLQGAGELETPR